MLRIALLSVTLALCTRALAQDKVEEHPGEGASATQASPIFGEVVSFALPQGFKPAFEKTSGNTYVREAVPTGETADQWTQMITVSGARGLAADRSVTPELFVTQIATGFKHACPDTFSARRITAREISGRQALIVVVGCGTVITSITPRSQAALVVAIKGSADYYTIQWAERGAASTQHLDLDDPKWAGRLNRLSPIKICPLVSGEAPAYPSCTKQN